MPNKIDWYPNKNAFVMRDEWGEVFEALGPEKGYKLLMMIYKSRTEGIVCETPRGDFVGPLYRMMLTSIINDDKTYADRMENKRQAGRKGGLKKAENAELRKQEDELAQTYYANREG